MYIESRITVVDAYYGKRITMNKNAIISIVAMLPLVGCLTNNYENFYVDTERGKNIQSIHGTAPIEIKSATTEDDVLDLIEDGYVSVGHSSFISSYTPMSLAVDTAQKHGAALVLLDIRFKETQQYTSVMFLPSTSTSYTSGTVTANACGPRGNVYGSGRYSGTTTTTTLNAVPVQRNRDMYAHDAMFFKKIDVSNLYGVQFFIPNRLPTESPDAPVTVRVLAVFHGTQAERDGIKRGQIVKAINGRPIRTRYDIAPFVEKLTAISSMEVEGAK